MSNQALSDERISEYRQMVAENDTEGYRIEMTIPELIATIDQAKEDERRRIDELGDNALWMVGNDDAMTAHTADVKIVAALEAATQKQGE